MENTKKIDLGAQDEDWISQLVDDLIFQFLCRLDMKSAAQTSILSKRWRYVWTNWTDLDFHPRKIIPEYDRSGDEPSEIETASYMNWVNQVMNAHQGPNVDHLRIYFPLDATYASQIDAWVKFAISKRVKKLDLDLFRRGKFYPDYRLGLDVLSGISFLTSLRLTRVDVSQEVLEFILLQCPLLEELYLRESEDLVSLKVMDLSCKFKLKRLSVVYCRNLESVEIHAGSLEYFDFEDTSGPTPTVEFKSVPSLVGATFGGAICLRLNAVFKNIACISEQLSALTFDVQGFDFLAGKYLKFPCFCNLKHLNLRFFVDYPNMSLLRSMQFIEACPVLSELKLEFYWLLSDYKMRMEASELLEPGRTYSWPSYNNSHPSLRVLEVVGFLGCNVDVRLVFFIARHAPNLNTIICDSHCYTPCFRSEICAVSPDVPDMKETSRLRASKLAAIFPALTIVII